MKIGFFVLFLVVTVLLILQGVELARQAFEHLRQTKRAEWRLFLKAVPWLAVGTTLFTATYLTFHEPLME